MSKELGTLHRMETEEGLELLLRSSPTDSTDLAVAEKILARVEYLPLAIDQVRAFYFETATGFSRIRERCTKGGK